MKHTPTPWRIGQPKGLKQKSGNIGIYSEPFASTPNDWEFVAEVNKAIPDNAAFIVTACNAHDDLTIALRSLLNSLDGLDTIQGKGGSMMQFSLAKQTAREALQKAGINV